MDLAPLALRPDRGAAAGWTAGGGALVALGAWLVADSGGLALAWVALAVFVSLGLFFGLQLVAPQWYTITLDEFGCHGRTLWHAADVPWEAVRVARVWHLAGDPMLELHLGDGDDGRAVGLLLPVGADVDALHRFLEIRLGKLDEAGPDTAPAR